MVKSPLYYDITELEELEEVKRVVLGTRQGTDGPVSRTILMLSTLISPRAAPSLPGVLPTVDPVSAPVVGDPLEGEGEDTALSC